MKANYSHILLVYIAILCIGCKDDKSNSTESIIILEGLVFNNGEKWIANPETHTGMKRIDSILKNNTTSDGKILGEALSKETSYIIKSCDMKGEEHNQLHVVLVPILEEITDIKEVTDSSELKNKVSHLKSLINTYFKHFKI
ncbi:hypothetical protein [uncultured Winogradskyella sp.]|uniref:hypothetical protein n=1 Tax=uncultured Winogradskyella sp. TaxID=395353 RepID=UPI0030D90AE6|tara:strand:- start:7142 stop:7567 length:426 start_codon:yes stop_codon:yes gene_type:complete